MMRHLRNTKLNKSLNCISDLKLKGEYVRKIDNKLLGDGFQRKANGPEKIIHTSHCCRLLKLATFIFYLYKENLDNSDFQFYYFESSSRSYGGYSAFKLRHEGTALPARVGNMRHARIDSAFFSPSQQICLRIENKAQEYTVKHLQTLPPIKGRKYPFVEI